MGAKQGQLYQLKHSRSLWTCGPADEDVPSSGTSSISWVDKNAILLFLREHRTPAGSLDWIKVMVGEEIGWMKCDMLSVGSLLKPIEDPDYTSECNFIPIGQIRQSLPLVEVDRPSVSP